jgi:hypothetical protein
MKIGGSEMKLSKDYLNEMKTCIASLIHSMVRINGKVSLQQYVDNLYGHIEVLEQELESASDWIKAVSSTSAGVLYYENTQLKQSNLMHVEDVKELQRKLESATDYGVAVNELGGLARNEMIFFEHKFKVANRQIGSLTALTEYQFNNIRDVKQRLAEMNGEYGKLQADRNYLFASLEKAMLDHQPVVLPKEVAEELQNWYNKGYSHFEIIALIRSNHCTNNPRHLDNSPMSRWADRHQNPFMRALADGYTVEQSMDEVNEEAFRFGMTEIYKEMDEIKYQSGFQMEKELTNKIIPLIKEIYQH